MNRWRQRLAELTRDDARPPLQPVQIVQSVQNVQNQPSGAANGHFEQIEQRTAKGALRRDVSPDSEQFDPAAIEERAGLAADRVPPVYLDAWARLNHQKPEGVSEAEWRQALDDGGRFLDQFGNEAAELGWTLNELFEVTVGVVWRLAGEPALGIGTYRVILPHGRSIAKSA